MTYPLGLPAIHNLGGKLGGSVILHNQYFTFTVTPLWTSEMWEGILQGCTWNSVDIAALWATLEPDEIALWKALADENGTVSYGEFTRVNYARIVQELEMVRIP